MCVITSLIIDFAGVFFLAFPLAISLKFLFNLCLQLILLRTFSIILLFCSKDMFFWFYFVFFSFQTLMNHFSFQSFTSLFSKVFWDSTEFFFFCEGLFPISIPFLKAKKFSVSSFVFHFFAFKISQFFPLKCLSRDHLLKTIHIHRLKWKVEISPWVDNSQ